MEADLSGDNVKTVSYRIVFTKPGAEATLQHRREEVVAYSTNGDSFGALKLAEFLDRLGRDGVPWPSEWQQRPSDEYPEVGQRIREIPAEDRRFVGFIYKVILRQPRPEPDREQDIADALGRIRDALE
jgi:hypothetical protein